MTFNEKALDLKENIEQYLLAYHYCAYMGYKDILDIKIYDIGILNDKYFSLEATVLIEANEYFKYYIENSVSMVLSDNFNAFVRERQIDELTSDGIGEPDRLASNSNVLVCRYQSMLTKKKANYHDKLNEYLSNTEAGDYVTYRREKCIVHKVSKSKKTCTVYDVVNDKYIKNVSFYNLTPRPKPVKKDVSELSPLLLKYRTKDLIYFKNQLYKSDVFVQGKDGIKGKYVSKEEVIDVLNTRGNV